MSDPLISERDALIQAIERAQQEVTKAQEARSQTEAKIPALQRQLDKQYATFVFVRSRLEKLGLGVELWGDDLDDRLKLLESEYEQLLAENRRLNEFLSESAAAAPGESSPGSKSASVEQSEPAPLDDKTPIEVHATPRAN